MPVVSVQVSMSTEIPPIRFTGSQKSQTRPYYPLRYLFHAVRRYFSNIFSVSICVFNKRAMANKIAAGISYGKGLSENFRFFGSVNNKSHDTIAAPEWFHSHPTGFIFCFITYRNYSYFLKK